jgi:hypothetical protein
MADKIGKAELKKGVKVDSAMFDSTKGETFSGLNILKLDKGEAAGPFVHLRVKEGQILGKPRIDKKTGKDERKPVDVYVATHDGREVRMPIAAAFTMKAKEANLQPGDVYLVRRSEDYTSDFGTVCKGYELKVTARAPKK